MKNFQKLLQQSNIYKMILDQKITAAGYRSESTWLGKLGRTECQEE